MENPDAIGTRERAVQEADALLTSGGYAAVSLKAVAQAIGILVPSGLSLVDSDDPARHCS